MICRAFLQLQQQGQAQAQAAQQQAQQQAQLAMQQIQGQTESSIAIAHSNAILDEKQSVAQDQRNLEMQERLELIKQGNILHPANLENNSVLLREELEEEMAQADQQAMMEEQQMIQQQVQEQQAQQQQMQGMQQQPEQQQGPPQGPPPEYPLGAEQAQQRLQNCFKRGAPRGFLENDRWFTVPAQPRCPANVQLSLVS